MSTNVEPNKVKWSQIVPFAVASFSNSVSVHVLVVVLEFAPIAVAVYVPVSFLKGLIFRTFFINYKYIISTTKSTLLLRQFLR